MQFNRFSKHYRMAIRKLIDYAEKKGLKVEFLSEKELGGGSGMYAAETKTISVQNNKRGLVTVLILSHEIGHYISESKKEVSKRQHKSYEKYPQKHGDKVLEHDANTMRYIEARAIYHSNKLLKRLKIKLNEKGLELDNIYSILSLDHIFDYGVITNSDRDVIWKNSKDMYDAGIKWTDLYKDFI